MKIRNAVLAVLGTALVTGFLCSAMPRQLAAKEKESASSRACVVLQGFQTFERNQQGYYFSGIGVYCSSSSSGAPFFPAVVFGENGNSDSIPLADAIAQLLQAGYHVEHVSEATLTYTLVK